MSVRAISGRLNMKILIQIQQELKVPKGQFNKFGNFRYRSAEDILEAVKPLLGKYNALLTLSDDILQDTKLGVYSEIGSRYIECF